MDKILWSKLIRLAHTQSNLRAEILPLLKSGSKVLDVDQIRKAKYIIEQVRTLGNKSLEMATDVDLYQHQLVSDSILATNSAMDFKRLIVSRCEETAILCEKYADYIEKQLQHPMGKGLRRGPKS